MWDGLSSTVLSAVSYYITGMTNAFYPRHIEPKTWKYYWIVLEVELNENLKK